MNLSPADQLEIAAFLQMVASCEQTSGVTAAVVTSIAHLAVATAYLHGGGKPTAEHFSISDDAEQINDAILTAIDVLWQECRAMSHHVLRLTAACCTAHLRSRGVNVDMGVFAPPQGGVS
jgi:hypothetical protein